jgi:hypothetical protein
MLIAILTIFAGALFTAGGLQELVVQGIGNSRLIPLMGGTLGTVTGALLLSAGIALLRESPRAVALTRAAAMASLPVFVLIGQPVWGLAGWAVTFGGLAWSCLLLVVFRGPLNSKRATA